MACLWTQKIDLIIIEEASDPRLEPHLDVLFVLLAPLGVDQDLFHALVERSSAGSDKLPAAFEEGFHLPVVVLGREVSRRGFDDGAEGQRARAETFLESVLKIEFDWIQVFEPWSSDNSCSKGRVKIV